MSIPILKKLHKLLAFVILLSLFGNSLPAKPTWAQEGSDDPPPSQELYMPLLQSPANSAPATSPHEDVDATGTRPNIVFILMDDLDLELMRHLPVLESLLTDRGTTFSNAFVTNPLCCESRATILRGQYPHNNGVISSHTEYQGAFSTFYELGRENSTLATWVQGEGYRTIFLGKYLNFYPTYASSSTYVPPGWDEWYALYNGKMYDQFNYTLNENGTRVQHGSAVADYLGDVLANKAVDFIQRTAADGDPFLVFLAPTVPHEPARPAPRHEGTFPGVTTPRTPSFNEADTSDKPLWLRSMPLLDATKISYLDTLYQRQLQSMLAVEEMVQRLITTLEENGQLDNTYIFFTSDNGFHRGQHRQNPGKGTPYEEDIRIPLIVRGPGVPAGRALDHIVLNLDFAPTFAALAGAAVPSFVDGRSLVPLLGGTPPPSTAWRRNFLIEHWQADAYTNHPDYRAVWNGTHLYAEYGTNERELYDLAADPYQLNSTHLSADRAQLTRLSELAADLSRCSGAGCRTLEDISFYTPTAKLDNTLFWGDLYHNAPGYDPQQETVPGGTCAFRCADGAGDHTISLLVAKNDLTSAYVRYGSDTSNLVAMTKMHDVTTAFHGRATRDYTVWSATIPASPNYDLVVNDGCTSAVLRAGQGIYHNPLGQWVQNIDDSGGIPYTTGTTASASATQSPDINVTNPDLMAVDVPGAPLTLEESLYLPSVQVTENAADNTEGEVDTDGGEFAAPDRIGEANPPLTEGNGGEALDVVLPRTIDPAEAVLDHTDADLFTDDVPVDAEAGWRDELRIAEPGVGSEGVTGDGGDLGTNLLLNPSFEMDVDNDNRPDQWSRNGYATRSASVVREGQYAIQHRSTSEQGYAISQVVPNITPGMMYEVGGWVNIPPSKDTKIALELEVRWLDVNQAALSTSRVKMYRAATSGWDAAMAHVLAPHNATHAEMRMVISNLGTVMYVDNLSFKLVNLLSNAGFELQPANAERPDGWTADARVSCSDRSVLNGQYAMRHSPLTEASYTLSQDITNLTGGTRYQVAAWVRIPATQDTFQFQLQVRWRDANQAVLNTTTLRTYSAETAGWELAAASLVAPARTSSAQVLMVTSNLKATVYVDDVVFQPGSLLVNGNSEQDSNNDTHPDGWNSHANVTRSSSTVRSGHYAMQHRATDNSGHTISQIVNLIPAARAYMLDAWVNIPITLDTFTFDVQVKWRDVAGTALQTTTVKRFTAATNGWHRAYATLTPPAGAVTAQVLLVAANLKATIFVDDVSFQVGNLLANGSFETDSNGDNSPDSWSASSYATRSNAVVRYGSYALRHSATNEASYAVSQSVSPVVSEKAYNLACDVNVPATSDVFSFALQVQWLNGTKVRGTSTVATIKGATNGWRTLQRTLVAPLDTTTAKIQMVVSGLSSTVYVDGCTFTP